MQPPRSTYLPLFVAFVASHLAAAEPRGLSAQRPVATEEPVSSTTEVFARWPRATGNDVPVLLEGVVTATMPSGAFRMHDEQLGLFVSKSPAGQALTAGDKIRVAGAIRKGGFSPWIMPRQITPLGRAPFPAAKPGTYGLLASGAVDNQWLEIEGVVRSAEILPSRDFAELDLGMSGGNLRVLVTYAPGDEIASLVDAHVRLRGVAAVNINKHGHVVEPSFRVPALSEITVEHATPAPPFALPVVPVAEIMRLPPGEPLRHRVRTSGVVTRRYSDTTFFLRDAEIGLKVETDRPATLAPGDRIDVAGFPQMEDGLAVLQHSTVRVSAHETSPVPVAPTLTSLLDGSHNSDLVTVRARLVDWSATGQNVTLIFQAGDHLFKGLLNQPAGVALSLPEQNSLVNVTGVCIISELEDVWFYQPRSFLLLVASLGDLTVVEPPPWWTPQRLWGALALTVVVLLAVAAWVGLLRRQMDRNRAVIEQQTRHAAALEERSRIARELHDTLEQGLTGLSLQMKALETDLQATPERAQARLLSARQMLRQSRALARNAIRELRTEATPARLEGLVPGLQRVANSWNQSGALVVDVQITGTPVPLAPRLQNHLLGIGTEAMTNAVKHGRADAIRVELAFEPSAVSLRIVDNGVGFDPQEHLQQVSGGFGLLGLQERAREIRGELRITSQPGHGAELVVRVPMESEAGGASCPDPSVRATPSARKPVPAEGRPVPAA